jgi:hypothetical protein
MAVLVTVALVMLAVSFLFKINSMPMFDIVRAPSVDLNGYPRRCRQVATNEDIHVGSGRCRQSRRSWQARKAGKPRIGLFETEGAGDCCYYQQERTIFYACTSFSMDIVFALFDNSQFFHRFRTLETEKPGLKYT